MCPFKETKDRVKYLCRSSKFAEAVETVEKYIAEKTLEVMTIDELTKVVVRYVIALNKAYNVRKLAQIYVDLVTPSVEKVNQDGNVIAIARLLYAEQRCRTLL